MEAALEAATARFSGRLPRSRKLYEEAVVSIPGGNTRSVLFSAPFPVFMKTGEGHRLFDEDGHEYVDFVSELTAGLYGHSHPRLKEALKWALDSCGLHLGATTVHEGRYAALLCARFGLEQVRFTNSGTEANLHCIAAARRFTGRRKAVVFRGGYHGGVLAFGSGPLPNVVDRDDFLVLQYNDAAGLRDAFVKNPGLCAAVLCEGMLGAGGAIPATEEFLVAIREVTRKDGALFILDEVMTSRLAAGGLQSTFPGADISPDMTTLGKWLGGGMPFGAFGGRADVMAVYDPRSPTSLGHSGTFQNNTMMLHAGFVGLSEIYTPEEANKLNAAGDKLRADLNRVFADTRICATGKGSLMCLHFSTTGLDPVRIRCWDDVAVVDDKDLKRLFWLEMLEAGFWVQPRGSIALNMQTPVESMNAFVEAAAAFCHRYRQLVTTKSSTS